MATLGGRAIGVSRFPSPSSSSYFGGRNVRATTSSTLSFSMQMAATKSLTSHGTTVSCSAVQESSSSSSPSTVTSDKEEEEEEVKTAPKAAPAAKPKPKPAAKAAAKPLPQMMEEDVIPGLKTFLEAKDGISEVDLSFQDNKLEGFFKKNGLPYTFWAFFPDGNLTGVKGFSLSCYGSEASTVEPFLIDEKKITARHVVFWVEKRLAAQGIIPVWDE